MTTKVIVTAYSAAVGITRLNSLDGGPTGPEEIVAANSEKEFSVTSTTGLAIRELAQPKEWPQWVDGVLYNTEAEFNAATAPLPVDDKKAAKAAQKAADDPAAADAAAQQAAAAAANDPATSSGKGKASADPVSGFVDDKGKK